MGCLPANKCSVLVIDLFRLTKFHDVCKFLKQGNLNLTLSQRLAGVFFHFQPYLKLYSNV